MAANNLQVNSQRCTLSAHLSSAILALNIALLAAGGYFTFNSADAWARARVCGSCHAPFAPCMVSQGYSGRTCGLQYTIDHKNPRIDNHH